VPHISHVTHLRSGWGCIYDFLTDLVKKYWTLSAFGKVADNNVAAPFLVHFLWLLVDYWNLVVAECNLFLLYNDVNCSFFDALSNIYRYED